MFFLSPLRTIRTVSLFLALALMTPLLTGCAGALIGAGATVGVAAYQERGLEQAARDTKLATQIRAHYISKNGDIATYVGIEVYEGRALLTGLVDTEELRAEAVRLTWEITGLKDVINEIQLSAEEGIVEFMHDSWISSQLQAKMTFDENIMAINYSIETVNSIIYLIGIAADQAELDRVIAIARDIERVRRVISHVRIKSGEDG
ncbi:MAG: BON domain-containing protein [Rhodospirillales bacterium]|nr:BON domain-containing protein [Rhodospirillales bacterium]